MVWNDFPNDHPSAILQELPSKPHLGFVVIDCKVEVLLPRHLHGGRERAALQNWQHGSETSLGREPVITVITNQIIKNPHKKKRIQMRMFVGTIHWGWPPHHEAVPTDSALRCSCNECRHRHPPKNRNWWIWWFARATNMDSTNSTNAFWSPLRWCDQFETPK